MQYAWDRREDEWVGVDGVSDQKDWAEVALRSRKWVRVASLTKGDGDLCDVEVCEERG